VHALNRKLAERLGMAVLAGPFAGMTLTPSVLEENLGPFLLGTYEGVLHPWVERAIAARPATVVDVGSKFGYYAVGMGLRVPGARVIAFDTDPWARRATAELAEANRCKVEVRGHCSRDVLQELAGPGTFIISDCEGYEDVLFGGPASPHLAGATLLIESHDPLAPGVEERITQAFSGSHEVESTADDGTPPRSPVDLSWLEPDEAARAVNEFRTVQRWLFLTPRPSPA
jgi:hypothetical protein